MSIVPFVTVALKLCFVYFGIAHLLDHFGKMSNIYVVLDILFGI